MNRIAFAMLAMTALPGFVTGQSAVTPTPPAISAADESAVRGLVNAFTDTWNRHDMKAMHELNTEDVEWINVVGHHWRGYAVVLKGHTAIHKGFSAKSTMSVESMLIRSLAPEVAVAVAIMHFSAQTDPRWPTVPAAKTRGSFTLVKRAGIWKFVHFQNTVIDPRAEKNDSLDWDENGLPRRPAQ